MELREYALPALQIMGLGIVWLFKAGAITACVALYIMFALMRVALVGMVFGRLPRNWMRYL